MSGCAGAENIIAINKGPEAPIFKLARFGIVGIRKGCFRLSSPR